MNMKKYFFILLIPHSFIMVGYADNSPNVLFIGIDDLRVELGCYGSKQIHSPNIDKLSREAVQFNRAYVQQAVCSASRASILSGCRPDTTGVDYPYSLYFVNEFLKSHDSLTSFFTKNGYYTRNLGKIHHGGQAKDYATEKAWEPPFQNHYQLPENIELGMQYKSGRGPKTPAFELADFPDKHYKDGMTTSEALATLDRIKNLKPKDQPFFLAVGYLKPHLPFVCPKKYGDLYDPKQIKIPNNFVLPKDSDVFTIATYALKSYAGPNPTAEENVPLAYARNLMHAYYACISFIDHQVGILLNKIKELGYEENTIVVLWSDHGYHLGHQGMWGKTTNYENATRSPLIIKDPRIQETSGMQTEAWVEYVDIYPTLAELCGLPIPQYLEGTSMVPLLYNPTLKWKSAAFSQFPRGKNLEGYAIRTNRFRYIEWWNKNKDTDQLKSIRLKELYDHEIDPEETVNVAANPEYKNWVSELESKLKAGWKEALPEGFQNLSNNPKAPPAVSFKKSKKNR